MASMHESIKACVGMINTRFRVCHVAGGWAGGMGGGEGVPLKECHLPLNASVLKPGSGYTEGC